MNLKSLSNSNLIIAIKDKAQKERELTLEILHLLKEVEVRKLYLDYGFSSLHSFCVEELKYSDAAAQRRIQSMRLLKEIPEAEEAIKEGRLNLTTVSTVQTFFVAQAKEDNELSSEGKRELLKSMEGKSKREAEKVLFEISPEFIPKERERVLTEDKTEIKFVADEKLFSKLQQLKALMSHKNAQFSYAELIEELADLALKKLDKSNATPPAERSNKIKFNSNSNFRSSRHIPLKVQRLIWSRDQARCQFKDPQTNRQCGSKHFIQIDHIKPYSQNGSSTDPKNLRLLCGQHNRWRYTQEG